MVPVVLTELLSDPKLPSDVAETISEVPLIEVASGYWQRAGALRAKVLAKRRKARLGDALIAQSCMDQGVPLITRDGDFRAFAEPANLNLVLGSGMRTSHAVIVLAEPDFSIGAGNGVAELVAIAALLKNGSGDPEIGDTA